VITTADITDLTIQLNENTALQVINQEEETVFAVDAQGQITLGGGDESSAGTITIPAGKTEYFLSYESVAEDSAVFITASEYHGEISVSISENKGITFKTTQFPEDDIKVDYVVLN
jgi:hypothetical protein